MAKLNSLTLRFRRVGGVCASYIYLKKIQIFLETARCHRGMDACPEWKGHGGAGICAHLIAAAISAGLKEETLKKAGRFNLT